MPDFSHLHCHSQFSLLDGAASIEGMFKKAKADGMKALAITDHGNMFGAFQFVAEAAKHEGVKPIVGCEFYVVADRHRKVFTKDDRDKRFHQLFLAKNEVGYKNLTKLCSLGYIEGMYSKYPRIDKELVLKYHEGLIATTCCLGAMVPQTILRHGEAAGRVEFEWWLDRFGEDYYIELQRHGIGDQEKVNEVLVRWAKEYNVKMIASNDSHYVDQKDSNAHDILLCINTGEKQATPKNIDFTDDGQSARGTRFAFFNDQFYFKTQAEMNKLFADLPDAIFNTGEIVDKIEPLKLKKDILLPNFEVPAEFATQDDFLRHITYEGARDRYREMTPVVEERLNFELNTIKIMGFAGYFLIVSDFIKAGRELGVLVGPGRGSAAGSAVAYCIGITNIDPIKYGLLFERFLNPDRKSMPDIDTDFDDEGRQKVIDYVVKKYGERQVAQIVTYGTMAAKSSIKDVARVLDLGLDKANVLAKLVSDKPGISLKRLLSAPIDGPGSLREKDGLQAEDIENAKKLREFYDDKSNMEEGNVLREAFILEGSVRGTGVHAAGIIIAPSDLTDILPMATAKDSDLLLTQFEGSIIEDAGVLKMDFLGLKTLTIIRDALRLIKQNHGIDIDIDGLPLDDAATYQLYQKGETNGTFQFESAGMQKYLRDLRPDKFDDLIAMNALYRPGPIEYIPLFINRKHGREAVKYDLPEMEELLKETYGISTYQEQIMLLSQKLANFSKGDADVLRKAMGKKQKSVLDKMKGQFLSGGGANGHPADKLEKIWTDWEAFASYAFNKSHSTCYALVAYQTAYLKTHYPGEYMSAVLTHSQSQIEKISFFLGECKRMGVPVKGPDVNESLTNFAVNKKGEIRYGLGAIKGVGEAAVDALIAEREKNGPFKNIFDFMRRQNLRTVNKKVMESLVMGGAFDDFGLDRSVFFAPVDKYDSFIEQLLKFGSGYQEEKTMSVNSLFGDLSDTVAVPEPAVPKCDPWSLIFKLQKEKDVCGLYLSGHPLDDFQYEWENFCTPIEKLESFKGRKLSIGGFVARAEHRISQKGTGWGRFTIQDYSGSHEVTLFTENYQRFKALLEEGTCVHLTGVYQQRYNGEEWELKLAEVRQLASIGGEKTESVTLKINVATLNDWLLGEIEAVCKLHKGKHTLKMELLDFESRSTLPMVSTGKKVNAGNEFAAALRGLGVDFSVN